MVRARALLLDAGERVDGGGLVLVRGRIARVLAGAGAWARARSTHAGRVLELEGATLAAGLVNAHAHLELSALAGRASASEGFCAWIGEVLRARASLGEAELGRALLASAAQARASGTTAVGEIDSSGLSERLLARGPLRLRLYRELLDARDSARTPAALARARAPFPRGALLHPGLAPHAPHTTSAELLAGVRALARRRSLALSVHWAESEEESRWLAGEGGDFASLLGPAPADTRGGLAHLEAAGLLGPRLSLVHANHPRPGERERVAAGGASVVHCPGSHAFFARAPFPARAWLAAGVTLALGTDSLASNAALDMRREMALARAADPALAPAEVWRMATEGGARALALGARCGRIAPGFAADLAAFESAAGTLARELEHLTSARPAVLASCVGGRWERHAPPPSGPTLVGGEG